MKVKLKRVFTAYGELLGEIYKTAPLMVIMTFIAAIVTGLITPLLVFVNSHIFDDGIAVAQGQMTFSEYIPYLVLFAILAIVQPLIKDVFIYGYVQPKSQLILRTALKGRMLQKIKRMKYEHFESETSIEIIDKAYNRTENAARHMFPMYMNDFLSSIFASIGLLLLLFNIKWWLLLTVLLPFFLETYLVSRNNFNIYSEMEKYWEKERIYETLGGFLKEKEFLKENKLNNSSDYLIGIYRNRMNSRNREYESYYFKQLGRNFTQNNITKFAILINVLILLLLFVNGEVSVGLFISVSFAIFMQVFQVLESTTSFVKSSGFHINTFDYYGKYFALSENEQSDDHSVPKNIKIEFRDVWFRYPGTGRDVLKGLSFTITAGEKISIVGRNGEGKSTMVKLLLGLFAPDRGEILINEKSLFSFSDTARSHIFGMVFQDFVRYSISAKENVLLGNIDNASDELFAEAIKKAKVDQCIAELHEGCETLLGREFDGGVDLSGGQWQRIAMARAFMGDKPVLILDEPTSQLDPIAESNLYSEFAEMADGKTAIFITHRLASTIITNRVFVISDGRVTENGTHDELMKQGGLYAEMFQTQKQWYKKTSNVENFDLGVDEA